METQNDKLMTDADSIRNLPPTYVAAGGFVLGAAIVSQHTLHMAFARIATAPLSSPALSTRQVLADIYRSHGVRGFFRGLPIVIVGPCAVGTVCGVVDAIMPDDWKARGKKKFLKPVMGDDPDELLRQTFVQAAEFPFAAIALRQMTAQTTVFGRTKPYQNAFRTARGLTMRGFMPYAAVAVPTVFTVNSYPWVKKWVATLIDDPHTSIPHSSSVRETGTQSMWSMLGHPGMLAAPLIIIPASIAVCPLYGIWMRAHLAHSTSASGAADRGAFGIRSTKALVRRYGARSLWRGLPAVMAAATIDVACAAACDEVWGYGMDKLVEVTPLGFQ